MSDGPAAASVPFDARALVEPVDRTQAKEFARRLNADGRVPSSTATAVIAIIVWWIVTQTGLLGLLLP